MPEPEERVEDTYRVTDGYLYDVDPSTGGRRKLGPGADFHPTHRQVEGSTLEGKARKVSESASVTASGADIGLRALPMTDAALELALEAGLDESDFEGVEPGGSTGKYLKSQVEDLAGS